MLLFSSFSSARSSNDVFSFSFFWQWRDAELQRRKEESTKTEPSSFLFSERKARGDSPLCAGEGFPFLLFRIPHLEAFPFFCKREEPLQRMETPAFSLRSFPKDGSPADRRIPFFRFFLFSLSLFRRQETPSSVMTDSDAPVFSFFSFFGKNGGNVLPEKSKKDGDSSLLTTDSDSMAISFFSFSLLEGRQEDAFRRRDEKDSFPRRKTENGDPARKAVFLFSLFSEKDKKPSSGGEDEGGREKQENMPEERKVAGRGWKTERKKKERRSVLLLLLLSYSLVLSK